MALTIYVKQFSWTKEKIVAKNRKRVIVRICCKCEKYFCNSPDYQFQNLDKVTFQHKKEELQREGLTVSTPTGFSFDTLCLGCKEALTQLNQGSNRPLRKKGRILEEDPSWDNVTRSYEEG